LKRLIAAFACATMLFPPCLASDWVEDGTVVEMDEAVLQSPAPTSVAAPSYQDMQTPEAPAEGLNMDLAEFTPGYAAAFGSAPVETPRPVTAKAMSLPVAFAETEVAAQLPVLGDDVSLEFRMKRLEEKKGIVPGNGRLRDRLNVVRSLVRLPPIPEGRLSWPDKFINAIGSGITGGAKAGGKAIVKGAGSIASGTSALVSSTGEFLSTPGVPELLLAGAILGITIPLAIEAGKYNGYSPLVYGFTNPYFVPSYAPVYSNSLGIGPSLITAPGSNSLTTPAIYNPYPRLWPFQSSSSYSTPGWSWTNGYTRKNGTYVAPYRHTNADPYFGNNWSTRGNINPFTGRRGTKRWP